VRTEGVRTVAGNHDRYLIDWGTGRWPHTLWMRLRRSDPAGSWMSDIAAGQAQIPSDDLAWLRALPEELLLTDGVYVWPRYARQSVELDLATQPRLRRQRLG